MHWLMRFLAVGAALVVAACGDLGTVVEPADSGGVKGPSATPITDTLSPSPAPSLMPEVDLVSNCYNWPAEEFSPLHHVTSGPSVEVGGFAIEFTLRDLHGRSQSLADLLLTKPVLLVLGSFTCPSYQRSVPELNALATKQFDAAGTYGDVVHFVHVYVIEPHPELPEPSPYAGIPVIEPQYGIHAQPRTYADRLALAALVEPNLKGKQLLLVDELTPEERNNPVWCSYGPNANPGYLIRRDGTLEAVHNWIDVAEMKAAIDRLVGK